MIRVRPVIRVRPDVCVWPGKARLGSKARLASKARTRFTSRIRTMFHRQHDFPPANALSTSKPTPRQQARSPNTPSRSGRMPTGEQAGPDGTPPKALNFPTRNSSQDMARWQPSGSSQISHIYDPQYMYTIMRAKTPWNFRKGACGARPKGVLRPLGARNRTWGS